MQKQKQKRISTLWGIIIIIAVTIVAISGVFAWQYFYKTADKMSSINSLLLSKEFCDGIVQNKIKDNEKVVNNNQKIISPGACRIEIGKGVQYLFSFDDKTTGNIPNFILTIYNANMNRIQAIPLDYPWFFSLTTINLHDDINFDGYKDLLIRVSGPRASEYTYYAYNPLKKIFEKNDILSYIFTPTLNIDKREISTTPNIPNYYFDDNGNMDYYTPEEQTTFFKFIDGENKWELVKSN
jgi:hypothetical protein